MNRNRSVTLVLAMSLAALLSAAPAATAAAPATATALHPVAVFYLGDTTYGVRLYREVHRHAVTTGVVRQAMNAMLHDAPSDPDYVSVWPRATTVRGISTSHGIATVDFSPQVRSASVGGAFELAALQQLVYTIRAAAPSVAGVHIRVAGRDVATLWGHADTRGILRPAAGFSVLAPVQIDTPANGADVGSPLTVRGVATVFEATVSWQVLSSGTVIRHGYVAASTGAPGRGRWAFTVTLSRGTYTVKAFETSMKDGGETFIDTKRVTVH